MADPRSGERKLSRKERELQFRMDIVIDAAEEVFAEFSYAKASVEEIAQRAEISVGTLYNLFHSKEEVYRAVVSRAQGSFFDEVERRIDDARGPHEKVLTAVSYYFQHFQRYQRNFRLYMSATNGFQWELKDKLVAEAQAKQVAFQTHVTHICEQGLDEGIFRKGIPGDVLAMTVLSIPQAFIAAWLDSEDDDLTAHIPRALAVVDRVLGTDVT